MKKSTVREKDYAYIAWGITDIKALRPNWPHLKCAQWLENNRINLIEKLTDFGWKVIKGLLSREESIK